MLLVKACAGSSGRKVRGCVAGCRCRRRSAVVVTAQKTGEATNESAADRG